MWYRFLSRIYQYCYYLRVIPMYSRSCKLVLVFIVLSFVSCVEIVAVKIVAVFQQVMNQRYDQNVGKRHVAEIRALKIYIFFPTRQHN